MRTTFLIWAVLAGSAIPAPAAEMLHPAGSMPAGDVSATSEGIFDDEMALAMQRMHAAMAAAEPTGNRDRDFAAMMIPHHQGAIDMAQIQLRFGHDERLNRLAAGIVVEQRQEIAVMQAILDEMAPAVPKSTMGAMPGHNHKENAR